MSDRPFSTLDVVSGAATASTVSDRSPELAVLQERLEQHEREIEAREEEGFGDGEIDDPFLQVRLPLAP